MNWSRKTGLPYRAKYVIFTENLCVRRFCDVSLHACVPLISVGLYKFVNVSVFASQRERVSLYGGRLLMCVCGGGLCVCVCVLGMPSVNCLK